MFSLGKIRRLRLQGIEEWILIVIGIRITSNWFFPSIETRDAIISIQKVINRPALSFLPSNTSLVYRFINDRSRVIRILFVDDSYLDIKICVYIYIAMVSYLWIDCKLAPSNYLSKLSLPIFLGLERRLNKPFDENSIFLASNNESSNQIIFYWTKGKTNDSGNVLLLDEICRKLVCACKYADSHRMHQFWQGK